MIKILCKKMYHKYILRTIVFRRVAVTFPHYSKTERLVGFKQVGILKQAFKAKTET